MGNGFQSSWATVFCPFLVNLFYFTSAAFDLLSAFCLSVCLSVCLSLSLSLSLSRFFIALLGFNGRRLSSSSSSFLVAIASTASIHSALSFFILPTPRRAGRNRLSAGRSRIAPPTQPNPTQPDDVPWKRFPRQQQRKTPTTTTRKKTTKKRDEIRQPSAEVIMGWAETRYNSVMSSSFLPSPHYDYYYD